MQQPSSSAGGVGNSILQLIIILLSYPAMAQRMENSSGSAAFLSLLLIFTIAINVLVTIICYTFFILSIFPEAIFWRSSGFFSIFFALLTVECMMIPTAPRRLMFIPVDIPSQYFPLALYGIFALFGGPQLDLLVAILAGYLHSQGHFDKVKPSSYQLEQLEAAGPGPGGLLRGLLHSVSRSRGWVLAGAALGHDAWIAVNANEVGRSGGGNNTPSARRLNASEELVEWIFANKMRPAAKAQHRTPADDGLQYWLSRTQNVGQVYPTASDPQTNLTTGPAQASDIEDSRYPPISVSPFDHHKVDNTSGCYCLSLLLNESDNSAPVTIKILSDWERLWTHLSLDKSDDIGRNSGFLFDLASILLYTYFYRLYNGSSIMLPPTPHDPSEDRLLGGEESESIGPVHTSSERWFDAVALMMQQVFGMCKSVVHCESRELSRNLTTSRHATSSYSHLLNIAFKFLVRHCRVNAREINLGERRYKFAFLFIFTILPLYFAIVISIDIIAIVAVCYSEGQSSKLCRNTIINNVLTLGGLTNQLFFFIVYGTMILSMIGLSYGSELAYFMIGAWLRRYSSLRRVSHGPDKDEQEDIVPSPAPSHHLRHEEKCEDHAEAEYDGEPELNDLTPHLTRDAIEHYLFIVEYLRQCGALWSPVIIVVFVYAFILMFVLFGKLAIFPLSQLITPSAVQYLIVFVLQIVLFMVFPTWSLAHVNACISLIEELFKNASAEDFKIIGGKEKWTDFVETVPPAWTLYGLWITYNRIAGLASTALTAGGTVAFTYSVTGSAR
eukprot:gene22112-30346_t